MRVTTTVLGALAALSAAAPAAHAQAPDRYALAGGCWSLSGVPGAEKVRTQATALGRYLLLRADGTFVTATGTATAPSADADWLVEDESGALTFTLGDKKIPGVKAVARRRLRGLPRGRAATRRVRRRRARCPSASVGGIVEGHMHWMTYEYFGGKFHCGRPWHPYGITAALPDCADIEGPQGSLALLPELPQLRQPGRSRTTRRLPEAHRVVQGQPHLRGHVLALGSARVACPACG